MNQHAQMLGAFVLQLRLQWSLADVQGIGNLSFAPITVGLNESKATYGSLIEQYGSTKNMHDYSERARGPIYKDS